MPDREDWLVRTLIELASRVRMTDLDEAGHARDAVTRLAELLQPGEVCLLLDDGGGRLSVAAASTARMHALFSLTEPHGNSRQIQDAVVNQSLPDVPPADQRYAAVWKEGFHYLSAWPLRWDTEFIGLVTVLHRHRITEVRAKMAQTMTEAAAIAVFNRRELRRAAIKVEQLQRALDSRVVIEQAKGAVAARLGITPSAAFELLRLYARRHNLKLAQVRTAAIEGDITPRLTVGSEF